MSNRPAADPAAPPPAEGEAGGHPESPDAAAREGPAPRPAAGGRNFGNGRRGGSHPGSSREPAGLPGSGVRLAGDVAGVGGEGTAPADEGRPGESLAAHRVDAEILIALVAEIARELRAGEGSLRVDLDTDLYRDLGLDSLARMELLARVERAAGASLPDRVLAEATTPRELLRAFESVRPSTSAPAPGTAAGPPRPGVVVGAGPPSPAPEAAAQPETDAVPSDAETLIDALAWHAAEHPEREHVRLVDESESETVVTYGALLDGARRVAAGLVRKRLTRGGRSRSCSRPASTTSGAFSASSSWAGSRSPSTPRPASPSSRTTSAARTDPRQRRRRWLITFDEAHRVSRLLAARADGSCRVATVGELTEAGESGPNRS